MTTSRDLFQQIKAEVARKTTEEMDKRMTELMQQAIHPAWSEPTDQVFLLGSSVLRVTRFKYWRNQDLMADHVELEFDHAKNHRLPDRTTPMHEVYMRAASGLGDEMVLVITEIINHGSFTRVHLQDADSYRHSVTIQPKPELPPHDISLPVDIGSRIVVTMGDQLGWTGTVQEVDLPRAAFGCTMRRPDGTRPNGLIWQRAECIARILDPVPNFSSLADAEAWLSSQDPKRRQLWATGSIVEFDWHAKTKGFDEKTGFAHPRIETVRCRGRVVGFMPWYDQGGPGYKVLAAPLGEPKILNVSDMQIIGLAEV